MAKQLLFNEEARAALLRGVNISPTSYNSGGDCP
jgi:hypothetical protein